MLRSLLFALVLGAPTLAAAEQFPEFVLHAEIRGDDGVLIGRVEFVERDRSGRVVAVEAPAIEPAEAPRAAGDLVAEQRREAPSIFISENLRREPGASSQSRAR